MSTLTTHIQSQATVENMPQVTHPITGSPMTTTQVTAFWALADPQNNPFGGGGGPSGNPPGGDGVSWLTLFGLMNQQDDTFWSIRTLTIRL
jgi:hypothetical protein